jgi:Tol biopolymer transport system component
MSRTASAAVIKRKVLLFLMLVVLILLAAGCERATPSKMLFVCQRDGNSEIYVMDADGSNQMNLTNNPAVDEYPCWSPDGEKIAFVSNRDGNREIYIMDADGSNQINLTNHPAEYEYLCWSPDGKKIIFESNRDEEHWLYRMNADGSNQTKLPHYPTKCDWWVLSPDCRKIAFPRGQEGTWDLWVMDLETGEETNLTHSSRVWYALWSPDGTEIAFTATESDGHYEIYLVNVDGSGLRRVTTYSGNVPEQRGQVPPGYFALGWFPDGEKLLVWLWDIEVRWDLVSMDKTGENEVNLTRDLPHGVAYPFGSCSPDGKKIAFNSMLHEIWVVDADGNNLNRLLSCDQTWDMCMGPMWQPR